MKRGRPTTRLRSKRILGIKDTTWISVWVILISAAILVFFAWMGRDALKLIHWEFHPLIISPLAERAFADDVTFKQPALAPEPERVRNIGLIRNIFGKDSPDAIHVFTCESGLRTLAENDHNDDGFPDIGVAQIHVTSGSVFSIADMRNPMANLLQAKRMFDNRGWQPWASSQRCWGGEVTQ